MTPTLTHSYSYGGGVQSTAMLVLAAQGHLPPGPFLFSNVGDDSEHPATLIYVRDIAMPFAEANGLEVHELHRIPRKGRFKGEVETLYGRLTHPDSRSLPIPVRMPDTGAPGTRSCTADFKIRVVSRWLLDHGASAENPVRVGIGISTDEFTRANSRKREGLHEDPWYPLLDLELNGRRGLDRAMCAQVIADAGLPVPPKSSCYFCPFHKPTFWQDMARDEPELFEKACALEELLIARREKLGKDPVYFTRFGKPLRHMFGRSIQGSLLVAGWDEDEGYRCGDVCDT